MDAWKYENAYEHIMKLTDSITAVVLASAVDTNITIGSIEYIHLRDRMIQYVFTQLTRAIIDDSEKTMADYWDFLYENKRNLESTDEIERSLGRAYFGRLSQMANTTVKEWLPLNSRYAMTFLNMILHVCIYLADCSRFMSDGIVAEINLPNSKDMFNSLLDESINTDYQIVDVISPAIVDGDDHYVRKSRVKVIPPPSPVPSL